MLQRAHRQGQGTYVAPTNSPTLAEIKAYVDLTSLGPQFGLVRVGCGYLCPFHEDQSPSLGIRGSSFRCFACGANGDVFDLVAHLRGCSFHEAVEAVCERLGLVCPTLRGRSDGGWIRPG
jgi:DNA primase